MKRGYKMKIAVTYENGNVFQHFGHSEQFKIYDISDGKIIGEQVVNTNGSGHGALAGFLKEQSVDVLICGGIGGGAKTALSEAGIKLYGGVTGEADKVVLEFLEEKLNYNPNVHCEHHNHQHSHQHCGENKNGCLGNGGNCL